MSACIYSSPIGELVLTADEIGLTKLHFAEQMPCPAQRQAQENPALVQTRQWLDVYFSGRAPDFVPPLHLMGTPFQMAVWELLLQIPYGQTVSYGALAKHIASQRGIKRMSAQAVGGAVGRNPIAIIVACHRVIGSDGSLTGYAAGLEKKKALLRCEGIWRE